MCLSELLKKGGNVNQDDLNKIAYDVMNYSVNEQGTGQDIKIFEHIDVIKQSFLRWKHANLNKFQQLQDIEHKDIEMILDKMHILQRHIT
jgi:hypothetical protein